VNLPQQYYESAAALLHRSARPYDGNYVPACLDASGKTVVRFDGKQAPLVPDGQLLSVASGDPAIKDRSLAALTAHWSRYFQEDFARFLLIVEGEVALEFLHSLDLRGQRAWGLGRGCFRGSWVGTLGQGRWSWER
jgi:hypothetical protein